MSDHDIQNMEGKEFFDRYGDEIRAIRIELGAVIRRRTDSDTRGSRLNFMLSFYALQETLSALIASAVPYEKDRKKLCDGIGKTVLFDAEGILADHAADTAPTMQ